MDVIVNWFNNWFDKLYETFIVDERYKWLIEGLGNTLIITVGALLIGIVLGTIVAVIKVAVNEKPVLKPLGWICDLYTTVVRGTPITVQLLISFFIIFATARDGVPIAVLTFGVNSGAYLAEIIRSGIMSIDKGQTEAGRSLGLSSFQTMKSIVFPQAIKVILPALGNEMIALLKETSIAGYVAVKDLTKQGNAIKNDTYDVLNPILLVALVYLVIVIIMTKLLNVMERRLRNSDH